MQSCDLLRPEQVAQALVDTTLNITALLLDLLLQLVTLLLLRNGILRPCSTITGTTAGARQGAWSRLRSSPILYLLLNLLLHLLSNYAGELSLILCERVLLFQIQAYLVLDIRPLDQFIHVRDKRIAVVQSAERASPTGNSHHSAGTELTAAGTKLASLASLTPLSAISTLETGHASSPAEALLLCRRGQHCGC